MQYKTHLATSMVVALPVLAFTDTLTIPNIAAVGLGALLPDIDEPNSFIGQRTRGVSDLIHAVFDHRGMTHSFVGIACISILMLLLTSVTPLSFITALCVVFGYCLHIIEDSFSVSGVKWLLPFSKKRYQSGFHVISYRTGGWAEMGVFLISVLLIGVEMKWFGMNYLQIPDGNILTVVLDTINSFIRNLK
ncbi:metal-dependent hydrolase [Bacillus paramycoides]|uniref:metal-dependent hydrolase n=1 Tax=Bacillus paramycoides TaxID=2026194 RepID=UPI0015BA1676|nr:metal-dependent hydrolase [Bacillus paramycoides]NWK72604.1 metal-dependent hydrolase [Bacillus paramycoides]